MARPQKLIPSYRKHKASGQAVTTINGREVYLGPHNTKASKLEYDRVITEWLASGRSLGYGTPSGGLTVTELAADYLAHLKGYHGTAKSSEWHRMKPPLGPLRALYGRTPVAEFGPLQLKTLREKFVALGWSRSYINHNVRRVVRMFRWGVTEGRVDPSIPQALAMVPGLRKGKTTARETDPVEAVDDALVDANQLQHAAATEVRKPFGLEAAQIVLGRAAAGVMQVYAERDLAKGLQVARAIG